ncbi:hypothetical protein PC128_g11396 [Phytophthora cactorum]|nr:hypothetical protein PC120_g4084 [Phytophthora cactorum]KAG3190334.1 hypothetical protein PC128_g11396 [Phytophthora cactorum]KAG4051158.1 hypothetical protein PC123_g13605 [Phytophthora cactorum]
MVFGGHVLLHTGSQTQSSTIEDSSTRSTAVRTENCMEGIDYLERFNSAVTPPRLTYKFADPLSHLATAALLRRSAPYPMSSFLLLTSRG